MAIFLLILPNMENVTFKSLNKTTLELNLKKIYHFLLFILKVGETKVLSDFQKCQWTCNFQHFSISKISTFPDLNIFFS